MKATPFSKEPYYPMLLSNGQDGILIDYSGSNFCSQTGHTHFEQTLGAATGWYKASSRSLEEQCVGMIIRAGYQVNLFGGPCEPDFYEQYLDAKSGVLYTDLVFQSKLKISVETFLTDDGLWCEKLTVRECPDEWKLNIGFRIATPISAYRDSKLKILPTIIGKEENYGFSFSYDVDAVKGMGALVTERTFEYTYVNNSMFSCDGVYYNAKAGETFSRVLICLDSSECESYEADFKRRFDLAKQGYDVLKEGFVEGYKLRTGCVSVKLPDEKIQQVYDMSRYVIQGSRNRKSGAVLLGIQPYLWGGGVYCSYDAYFDIMALLSSGDKDVINGISKFFDAQADIGEEALKKAGMSGISFTGWTDCFGNFGYNCWSITEFFLNVKPVYLCNEIINRYAVWKYGVQKTDERLSYILKQTFSFIEKYLLKKVDGRYRLINVKAGNEAGFDVEADTFTIIALSQALFAIADMLDDKTIYAIGEDVLEGLEQNYTDEGVLLPFKDATFLAGMQTDFYLYSLPKGIPFISIERALENGKTPWGYDFGQPHEVYRHWPWIVGRAAICYAHEGRHKEAMEFVELLSSGATSLGALPEKIRIDGMPINYWYTSAHALVVWAIHDAFVHVHDDELRICYGITDKWQNFSCDGICTENGLAVSVTVEKGELLRLKIRNNSEKITCINIKLNPCFSSELPESCILQAGQEFCY